MGFMSVLSFAHQLVRERVQPGDTAIDATAGGGNDTLVLARLVGHSGKVLAFDIQETALEHTAQRLTHAGIQWSRMDTATAERLVSIDAASAAAQQVPPSCVLVLGSHADMERWLERTDIGTVASVMFNLGYLPGEGADQSVITQPNSTLPAMEAALHVLRPGGMLTVVVYPGHPGGAEEAEAVENWTRRLPQAAAQVLVYRFGNGSGTAAYLIAVEKRASASSNEN